MTIALILCIPATALVVGILVLKSVQLGLRWQVQVQAKEQPTFDLPNPIAEAKQKKEISKQVQLNNDLVDEWLNGPKESR